VKFREEEDKYILFCSKCGKEAATYQIERDESKKITSIKYEGNFSRTIKEWVSQKVLSYLKEEDVWGLNEFLSRHNITYGGIDLYCRKCQKVYCPDCWETRLKFEDGGGWYDYAEGVCPEGHKTIIDD